MVLPKYEDPAQLRDLRERVGDRPVVVGIETARGVARARELLAEPGLVAGYFGAEDFIASVGGRRTSSSREVLFARSEVLLAARLGGVGALDQAVVNVRDEAFFRTDAGEGRDLGYDGKICIHPTQVTLAHEVFTPSEEEVAHARDVVEAGRAGVGVVDGEMVDDVHLRMAAAVLARAGDAESAALRVRRRREGRADAAGRRPSRAGLPALAARAEELGFAFLGAGEHVLFGSPTSNAFVTLAAAAATTARIRLLSAVTLLPLYPPALAAKMAATLDRVSGGRFELGVGVGGENPAEFAACGVPVSGRGRRTDAALDVVRAYLAGDAVPVEGGPTRLDPLPLGPVPVWIGGRTEASMRRAGRAGEVWMPYLCSPDRVTRGLRVANDVAAEQGRGPVTGGLLAWSAVAASRAEARTLAVGTLQRITGRTWTASSTRACPTGPPTTSSPGSPSTPTPGRSRSSTRRCASEGGYAAVIEEVGAPLGAARHPVTGGTGVTGRMPVPNSRTSE